MIIIKFLQKILGNEVQPKKRFLMKQLFSVGNVSWHYKLCNLYSNLKNDSMFLPKLSETRQLIFCERLVFRKQ